MNELLPIIRRKRRPLIEEDVPPVVTSLPPAPPVTAEPPLVEAVEILPAAPAEMSVPEFTPVPPQPKRKKKNADAPEN